MRDISTCCKNLDFLIAEVLLEQEVFLLEQLRPFHLSFGFTFNNIKFTFFTFFELVPSYASDFLLVVGVDTRGS